jgi:metallo-beta-lactamase family protein
MSIKLTFLGAAQSVTGSRYLIETDGISILVDCGLCQERECRQRDWEPFPVPPESIEAVLITHAHLDHCGYLPKLVSQGFHGPVYCTEATADIIKIILLDAAKLMEEDAEFKKKRHERERRKVDFPELPLYTQQDAEAVFPLFKPVQYDNNIKVTENIEAVFYNAGHVLGSADIKIMIKQKGFQRSILFSGDLGAEKRPIVQDRKDGIEADYVLVESTYGNRSTPAKGDILSQLAKVINTTEKAGGNIVIPAFALERAQDILYYINELLLNDRISHLMVFLDSPMAVNITEIFEKYPELFDEEMRKYIYRRQSPFRFVDLKLIRSADESKAINHIKGTVIIIAGSGMCTGGRIKHHLVANISRSSSTILFVGYQATGTLGRLIVDGVKKVRILGKYYNVKAHIVQIQGFSAHADREQLLEWLLKLRNPPKRVFVVHGETESAKSFAELVTNKTGWPAIVPDYKEEVILE